MKKILIIVPVSQLEASQVVLSSAKKVKALDYENLSAKIVYVIDVNSEADERIRVLNKEGVEVFSRQSRGKRAGAVNDALIYLADFEPDYVALFDVASRPSKNSQVDSVKHLDGGTVIASSPRYVTNADAMQLQR